MGSVLYDFLNDSRLFEGRSIANDFEHIPEKELRVELRRYRDYCANQRDNIVAEIPPAAGTNLFLARTPSIDVLKRTALYVPCHIVADPLLGFTQTGIDDSSGAFLQSAGIEAEQINRKRLAQTMEFMRAVRPMVAANCLRFWPTQVFADPKQVMEIEYSESRYRNELPTSVHALLRPKAVARTVFTREGASYVQPTLEPCRKLSIRFEGDEQQSGYFYVLHRTEVLEVDKETRRARVAMTVPERPPPREEFAAWLEQSINRSALTFLEQLVDDHRIAAACGGALELRSPLSLQVMQTLSCHTSGIQDTTRNNLLELDLPFLDGLDLDTLVGIRTNEGEAFEAFRRALEVGARDLRLETDATSLLHRQQNLAHQLAEVEVAACESKITALRRRGLFDASIAGVSLAAAVATSGWSLLAGFAAMAQGYRTFDEYRSKVKATPGYFLWRLRKESAEV